MRLIHTTETIGDNFARIYYDSKFNEYVVKFFHKGIHQQDADYHTDDETDAYDTASLAISERDGTEFTEEDKLPSGNFTNP